MNRKILITAAMGILIALSQTAFGKAHVPVGNAQLCVNGKVLEVNDDTVGAFLKKGPSCKACILPVCDFNNIFTSQTGCAGIVDTDNDGLCEVPNLRDEANTPACVRF